MKQTISKYTNLLRKLPLLVAQYSIICFFVVFGGLAGFLVMKVGNLSQAEPSQFQVDEKLSLTKETKIDVGALKVVRDLKSREGTTVPSFDKTRTNPFEDQ